MCFAFGYFMSLAEGSCLVIFRLWSIEVSWSLVLYMIVVGTLVKVVRCLNLSNWVKFGKNFVSMLNLVLVSISSRNFISVVGMSL